MKAEQYIRNWKNCNVTFTDKEEAIIRMVWDELESEVERRVAERENSEDTRKAERIIRTEYEKEVDHWKSKYNELVQNRLPTVNEIAAMKKEYFAAGWECSGEGYNHEIEGDIVEYLLKEYEEKKAEKE